MAPDFIFFILLLLALKHIPPCVRHGYVYRWREGCIYIHVVNMHKKAPFHFLFQSLPSPLSCVLYFLFLSSQSSTLVHYYLVFVLGYRFKYSRNLGEGIFLFLRARRGTKFACIISKRISNREKKTVGGKSEKNMVLTTDDFDDFLC